jgi:hypothetical protein
MLKDIYGVVHLKEPGRHTEYPWCTGHPGPRTQRARQRIRYRLVKWIEPGETTNCVRCLLISIDPLNYAEYIL